MNQLMTPTQHPIHPASRDAAFFDLVADLRAARRPVDAWQRRGIEWARLADRLRSLGHAVSIGRPL